MRICIPITSDQGIHSPLSRHFGSAPLFLLIDTDTNESRAITNERCLHEPGECGLPVETLETLALDAVVVASIGTGALAAMKRAMIPVFLTEGDTVEAAVEAFKARGLRCLTHDRSPSFAD